MHSSANEQAAPSGFLPHELPTQEFGAWHCTSIVQAPKHLVPLQT
jgi:hypothetical protein